jgi:predicted O-methyltransferase YrrM
MQAYPQKKSVKDRNMKKLKSAARAILNGFEDFVLKSKHRKLSAAFSVNSHLTTQERIHLYLLSKNKFDIVEIGSYVGASACCFGASTIEDAPKKIICIDTWNNDAMTEGNRDTWTEFKNNTADFSEHVIPVRGFSTDVVEQVRAITPALDLLFIDGDHSYEGVKADWEAYKGFLKPGSIVIFHDYGWAEGVKRVVHEDVLPLVSSHDKLPNMWWGTLAKQP